MTILMGKSAIYDLSCFEEEVQHMQHWPNQQGHNSFIMAIKEHVIRRDKRPSKRAYYPPPAAVCPSCTGHIDVRFTHLKNIEHEH
jgi:uncharacterized OB-fold protein